MPKKKKTRKQKIISEMRHREYKTQVIAPKDDIHVSVTPIQPKQEPVQAIATQRYSYLYSDLRKTIILTFMIVLTELILGYLKIGAN